MNVVDSSAWLEYFADGPNAEYFSKPIEDAERLLVPSVVIYEVFKKVLIERGEDDALQVAAQMRTGRVVSIDEDVAIDAARLSAKHKTPMADGLILATAGAHKALVWTQDEDFEGLSRVNFRKKSPNR